MSNALTVREARREAYRTWLQQQEVRFGFADELADYANHVHKGVRNDTPAEERWSAMLPTVRVLEQIRERFGPTVITSAYRSLLYNATFLGQGAVKDSLHTRNIAIDFHCRTGTPGEWAAFARGLRRDGVFTGGVGLYLTRRFVHIDTRGTVADWNG